MEKDDCASIFVKRAVGLKCDIKKGVEIV